MSARVEKLRLNYVRDENATARGSSSRKANKKYLFNIYLHERMRASGRCVYEYV